MALLKITVFVILVFLPCGHSTPSWSYNGIDGEQQWSDNFPSCSGPSQSPINFKSQLLKYNSHLPPIQPQNYNLSSSETLTFSNNGNTAMITLPSTMTLSGLPAHYTASAIHFHWGATSTLMGSEHTVNNKRFPAEMHILHYDSDRFQSVSEAENQPKGLAVLGVFIEVGAFNPAFDQVLRYFSSIKYAGQSTQVPGFNIQQLLPDNLNEYYQYEGSLTTPPCYPGVLWTVFRNPVTISYKQYLAMSSGLFSSQSTDFSPVHMNKNYRKSQAVDNREVQVSFNEATSPAASLKKTNVNRKGKVRKLKQRSLGRTRSTNKKEGKMTTGKHLSKTIQLKKTGFKDLRKQSNLPVRKIIKPSILNKKTLLGKTSKHGPGKSSKYEFGKQNRPVIGKPFIPLFGKPTKHEHGKQYPDKTIKHHLDKSTVQPLAKLPVQPPAEPTAQPLANLPVQPPVEPTVQPPTTTLASDTFTTQPSNTGTTHPLDTTTPQSNETPDTLPALVYS